MADWMNDMANAVEEAEAAQARAQEEVPTEPAISPRDSVLEVPINDGQWTADEYAKIIMGCRRRPPVQWTRLSSNRYCTGNKPSSQAADQAGWSSITNDKDQKNYSLEASNMVLVQSLRGFAMLHSLLNDGTPPQEAYEQLARKAAPACQQS